MKWFREARFGVFICWGPCAIDGGEIGWSRRGPRPGIGPTPTDGIPMEEYDNLYKRFNPTLFDAREWAQIIKASGARYVIFLTRHHDGFSMFDTAVSDYKVTNSPLKRDVSAELAKALHEAGIKIFWYYSQPDWVHPDYLTENHQRFLDKFLFPQIRELLTKYGKIDGMWFDGLQGDAKTWDSARLLKMIHQLQPGIIVNNRSGLAGDFDTPEQTLGTFNIDRPWESCITMSTGWSWGGEDAPVKSLQECLDLLIRCAGGGGNLALDTGPMPDGRISPLMAERYRAMGKWLQRYGQTIYATQGGPYKPGRWGCSTRKGDTIYLHVLDWNGQNLTLPPLPARVVHATALTGGTPIVAQTKEDVTVTLPPDDRRFIDTIIALKVGGSAMDIEPIALATAGSLTVGKTATASGEWSGDYAASKAFDGNEATRWGAEPGSHSGWLQIDLGGEKTFDRAVFLEATWDRVEDYELQVREGETWRTFYHGGTMGDVLVHFKPVTGRYVRLNVIKATDVPTIWEVDLYAPETKLWDMGLREEGEK
jgi:alpha-L-fucosidase